ncbi:MAG: GrpB family protein [Patescibacteria group bacterium]|nr:GrpB family protein [Patescibacteria group bacterium]
MKNQFLLKYQNSWVEKFQLEEKKIKEVLNNSIKEIQHIGSTSIPGMIAKPIIDIGVLVDSIEDISFFVEKLSIVGYLYFPAMSSVERIFLRKGNPTEYHLSIACPKHGFWDRNIMFRDCLRNHPELIEEYTQLKLNNISITPEIDFRDLSKSQTYNNGKGEFVKKVLDLAKKERVFDISI